jgi:Domain of unknown function (DUF4389)
VLEHPVRLVVRDDLHRSRLTVFFRLLLALPHFVWIFLWSIGAFFAAVATWAAALVTGRPPYGLHRFLAGYVRYSTHLSAYLLLAANPYPGFTGAPGYPIDIELPEPGRQARWKIALRLVLALPALLLAAALGSIGGGGGSWGGQSESWAWALSGVGGVAAVCALLGWFACLALGRMPNGLRDLASYSIGYTAQAYAYLLLLTERYPTTDPEAGPDWRLPSHPVRIDVSDDGRRSRLTVFFRLLLALPHVVWITLWSLVALFAAVANGVVALLRGRSAEPLHRFLAAYVRYATHVGAFLLLAANPFPGFTGTRRYPVDVSVGGPAAQRRWITFFRLFLAIPALLVSAALAWAAFVAAFLGWFVALLSGRIPDGLRKLVTLALRYSAQTNAYWLVLTDVYPYAGPALQATDDDPPLVHAPAEA